MLHKTKHFLVNIAAIPKLYTNKFISSKLTMCIHSTLDLADSPLADSAFSGQKMLVDNISFSGQVSTKGDVLSATGFKSPAPAA